MKSLWFLWIIICAWNEIFAAAISYDPHQIYYQGRVYQGVEFVGIETHEECFLEISKRINVDLLDYPTGMIWPKMSVYERQQFLEDLNILDEQQIAILATFEAQNMFPETMHPLNRIKVVQRTKLWGYERVSPFLLRVLSSQDLTSKEQESAFAQVLSIDDFYPGFNGFLESLTAGLEEADYEVVIDAFQKAKLSNMQAGLCAVSLIDLMMPTTQRVDVLDRISKFTDGENAVLLNTNFAATFQDMPYEQKISLLRELKVDPRSTVLTKMRHISSERRISKGESKRKKITLAPL